MTSTRQKLADLIEAEWADIPALASVRVVATERDVDDVHTPTLIIRLRTVERSTAQGVRDYGFLAQLLSGHEDLDAAADELDDLIPEVRDWLDTTGIRSGQTRIVGAGNRLAAETDLTIYTAKNQE